jgi:hypothetical protein
MSVTPRRRDSRRWKTEAGGQRAALNPQSVIRNPQFLVVLSLAIFAGIPFALGKYFELKCPDPFDSGSYVYSAQHVLSGARIGYDEKPSAQAGTLLVNMLGVTLTGFNETGSKVLQGLFQAAALTLMFLTVRPLYGSLAAVVSVTLASVYLSAPLIAKFGNVKEQFMIALMIMGICCFVWYRLTGRWWWALLTGMLLVGGPMFKQTGVSAIGAVAFFVLLGALLRHYAWKKAGRDVLLLVAGAAVTLTPICAWYARMRAPLYYWPYSFAFAPVFKLVGVDLERAASAPQSAAQEPPAPTPEVKKGDDSLLLRLLPGYVSDSWRMLDSADRRAAFRRVLRYYRLLILPIALATGALLARGVVLLRRRRPAPEAPFDQDTGRFVPLFAAWWLLDMAFVWISPHSYEQYYLPLNASGAVLGGYLVGLYAHRLQVDPDRTRWAVIGMVGLLSMVVLSWHIFFGRRLSRPAHGQAGPHPGVQTEVGRDCPEPPVRLGARGRLHSRQFAAAGHDLRLGLGPGYLRAGPADECGPQGVRRHDAHAAAGAACRAGPRDRGGLCAEPAEVHRRYEEGAFPVDEAAAGAVAQHRQRPAPAPAGRDESGTALADAPADVPRAVGGPDAGGIPAVRPDRGGLRVRRGLCRRAADADRSGGSIAV